MTVLVILGMLALLVTVNGVVYYNITSHPEAGKSNVNRRDLHNVVADITPTETTVIHIPAQHDQPLDVAFYELVVAPKGEWYGMYGRVMLKTNPLGWNVTCGLVQLFQYRWVGSRDYQSIDLCVLREGHDRIQHQPFSLQVNYHTATSKTQNDLDLVLTPFHYASDSCQFAYGTYSERCCEVTNFKIPEPGNESLICDKINCIYPTELCDGIHNCEDMSDEGQSFCNYVTKYRDEVEKRKREVAERKRLENELVSMMSGGRTIGQHGWISGPIVLSLLTCHMI